MFGEAVGGYLAGTNQFVQTPQAQQFTQVAPGEAQACGRPPPLQLDSQQFGQQDLSASYMMPAQSPMMWPQTPCSFPPTPAAVPPQMYTGVSQTPSFVDVAHATWPQSPYVPTAQPMLAPAMQQHNFQQAWYQQPQHQQPQQPQYQQPQQPQYQQPQQPQYQQPQQAFQQAQVQPGPNIIPSQQMPWEEERRRQQALALETRAKQQAWATEMQRHHLTYSNQAPAVQPQVAPTLFFPSQTSGPFSYQPEQPVAPSASSFAAPSSQVRSQATTTQSPVPPRSEASNQVGDRKPGWVPDSSRRFGNVGSTERPKPAQLQMCRDSDDVQASEQKTPVKSRPTLSIVPSPTAKDSRIRVPRGEAWATILPSPSGQSEKSWRSRGNGEWASVPVETEEWSQDWGESTEKEKVDQPGPKKVRTRGKFKADGGSPVGSSAASSPAQGSAKGRLTSSWNEGHSRRRDKKDYDDSWYQDSWWYEGYEEAASYGKGKTTSQRKRAGR